MNLARLFPIVFVVGCGAAAGENPADAGPDGGKADCTDCEEGGELPLCEDDDDLGCLRHGLSSSDWDDTKPEFVNPGWSAEVRQRWNHQDQGTKIFPLSWILALEPVALLDGGSILADQNLLAYGMLPDHDPRSNPYQLPVGFTTVGDFNLEGGVEDTVFGYTCAACHTQAINIDDTTYQVAGGSGLQDFNEWNTDMVLALVETRNTIARRGRFIERVQAIQEGIYGEALTEEQIGEALDKYSILGFLAEKIAINSEFEPTPHGPGRLDALGRGFTTLHHDYLEEFVGKDGFTEDDRESNLGPIDGMVSMPPVYDAPKWDWAEYGHSIRQAFARNTSEAVAVNSGTNLETLEGDVNAEGLFWIEQQLRLLEAPTYPGKIDDDRRAHGQALFWGENVAGAENAEQVNCARCHAPRETYDGQEWKLTAVPLGVVGTDPNTLTNFATREVTLPKPVWQTMFSPRVVGAIANLLGLELDPDNPQRVPAGLALFGLVDAMGIKLFDEQGWDWKSVSDKCRDPSTWDDGGECEATLGRLPLYRVDIPRDLPKDLDPMKFLPPEGYDIADPRCNDVAPDKREACLMNLGWLAYRARPLHGMWNAAPFLHNNAVPNLCLLLGDPKDRPEEFYVGNIDFDPECLGYRYEKTGLFGKPEMPDNDTNAPKFDTTDSGNSNKGHVFSADYDPMVGPSNGVVGRKLTDEEIAALVEYVKSLPALPPGPDGHDYADDYTDNRFDERR